MNPAAPKVKRRQYAWCGKTKRAYALLLLCVPLGVIAGDKILALSPMTVYANPANPEADPPGMGKQWDRDALQATEMPNLNGVLRNQTDLTLNQGSAQMATGISLRGASGGQGLVTLDGVPLFANFAGFYSLSHYSPDALDSITVTSGLGGERHSSRTLGGAIHLQTRQLPFKDSFLRIEGGSYDTVRAVAGSGLSTRAGDFSAVVGRSDVMSGVSQAQNGLERDNFGMTHASGNWSKAFAQGRLNASLYFVRSDEDADGPGLVLPRRTVGWVDDKRGRFTDETWVAQLQGQYTLAKYWQSALQFGYTQDRQQGLSTLIRPYTLTSQLYLLDWQNTHRVPLSADKQDQAVLVWGVNTQLQQAVQRPVSQTVVSPHLRGELVLGAWQWHGDGRFDVSDAYGNHSVFSVGMNRALPKKMRVWMNGGSGYRQPGVSELVHPVFGNPALHGEHSAGGEVGWGWQPTSGTEVKINGYYQTYRQMITLQLNAKTGISQAGNIPEAHVWGAQMQSQHRWSNRWTSGLSYGYMQAINPLNQLFVANRPEHQGVFWNELRILPVLSLRAELNVHSGYWFDAANTLKAKPAPRINIVLKYALLPTTEVYVRGENITNQRTPELYDFTFNGAAVYAGLRTGF